MSSYQIDLQRQHEITADTGVYVRAQNPDGSWASADIAHLTRESLIAWLASRDAEGLGTTWRDRVVCILLGHQP